MTTEHIDPEFATALREHLVAAVQRGPRRFRRLSWPLGVAASAGVVLVGGGIAYAAGVFSAPGAANVTPRASPVTATHTGTATVDLGPHPAAANDVSLRVTCLSAGTFSFPGGSTICSATDVPSTASVTVGVAPGQDSVTIHTTPNGVWTLQAVYVDRTRTTWGVNAQGESYGVHNTRGTPDLVAVAVTKNGIQGYVKASDMACASGEDVVTNPTQAIAWDKYAATHNVAIPVYEDNGTTVIGTFVVGEPKPGVQTVHLATSGLPCAANPPQPPHTIEPPPPSTTG